MPSCSSASSSVCRASWPKPRRASSGGSASEGRRRGAAPGPMSDLSDAEIDELDELLARTPEPYRPLDAVMLDGYLCGVLVQPRPIEPDEWLPPVFDLDGAAFPASADAAWRARCEALITRRHEALREALLEDGWFDPLLPEIDADSPEVP